MENNLSTFFINKRMCYIVTSSRITHGFGKSNHSNILTDLQDHCTALHLVNEVRSVLTDRLFRQNGYLAVKRATRPVGIRINIIQDNIQNVPE